jgi:hypothetical protein
LKDVSDEDEALNKTADADSESHGVKGQLQRQGDLSGSIKIHPHFKEIPAQEGEKAYAEASRDNMTDVSHSFREPENEEVHKHMAFEQGSQGNSETDHYGAGKSDQFIGANDRPSKRPQDDVRYGQEHHEGDGDSCNHIEKLAESLHLVDYRLHEAPLLEGCFDSGQNGEGMFYPSLPLTVTSEASPVLPGRT